MNCGPRLTGVLENVGGLTVDGRAETRGDLLGVGVGRLEGAAGLAALSSADRFLVMTRVAVDRGFRAGSTAEVRELEGVRDVLRITGVAACLAREEAVGANRVEPDRGRDAAGAEGFSLIANPNRLA